MKKGTLPQAFMAPDGQKVTVAAGGPSLKRAVVVDSRRG